MVKKIAAAALVLFAPLVAASCQVLFGIDEKRYVPPDAATPEAGATDSTTPDTSVPDGSAPDGAQESGLDAEAGQTWARTPPPRPLGDAAPSDGGKTVTLAMRRLFLGSIDPVTDESNGSAWRSMGYDIDGQCTTAEESKANVTGVCQKRKMAADLSQEDGDECRDNAGGRILAGAFTEVNINYERLTLAQTNSGEVASLVLQIENLDPGPDDPYAPAKLYVSAPRKDGETPPLWDGNDRPRIDNRSVVDGGLDAPKVAFLTGYVRDHVWISNDFGKSPMMFPMPLFGDFSFMEARTATLTVRFNESHSKVTGSVLSAAATMPSVETAVWPGILALAGCNTGLAQTLSEMYVRRNADLADKPPLFIDDPAECSLLSIGLQPDWAMVLPPDTVAEPVPAPAPCSDAGTTD